MDLKSPSPGITARRLTLLLLAVTLACFALLGLTLLGVPLPWVPTEAVATASVVVDTPLVAAQPKYGTPRALVLHSYHPGLMWTDHIHEGF